MRTAMPGLRCYLAEWYRPEVTERPVDDIAATLDAGAAILCAEGTVVRLLMALAVRSDQVLYGVFAACSPETVVQVCRRAGIPAERLTADVDARISNGDGLTAKG